MEKNKKTQYLSLKQYGFSSNLLEYIYAYDYYPLEAIFDKKSIAYADSIHKFTKKDFDLSLNYGQYYSFVEKFLLDELGFLSDENIKIYFKFDNNDIDEFLPKSQQPLFFYSKGDSNLLEKENKRVSVIGTRNPSSMFIKEADPVLKNYIDNGYVIVSGLAEGVDTFAHNTALEKNGKTIAVLPTNFIKVYPKNNIDLSMKIAEKGLLLSSIGPYENTYKSSFLERNGYVAAISEEIFVVETAIRSGTMNTIRQASKMKKKITFLDQKDKKLNDYIIGLGGKVVGHT